MVTLQRLHITAPSRKSILPTINGREAWRQLTSTSIYENPLKAVIRRLQAAIFTTSREGYKQVLGKPNSIMLTPREVVISKLNDKSRSLKFNKGLALEVHYYTPEALFRNKPFDAWLKITYRNLRQEIPFVYDEVKILEVIDFLLEHRLPFREYKNGNRALRGKAMSSFESRKVDVDLKARW